MKQDAATLAIVNAWDASWVAVYGSPPSVPYFLDNEQVVEPNPPSSWVRLAIRHELGLQRTHGRPARYYRSGKIFVQIFTPAIVVGASGGRKPLDLIAENVQAALEAQTFGTAPDVVTTYACSTNELPADAQWFQANVVTPFDYWEQK